jgi:hypothetical protein
MKINTNYLACKGLRDDLEFYYLQTDIRHKQPEYAAKLRKIISKLSKHILLAKEGEITINLIDTVDNQELTIIQKFVLTRIQAQDKQAHIRKEDIFSIYS